MRGIGVLGVTGVVFGVTEGVRRMTESRIELSSRPKRSEVDLPAGRQGDPSTALGMTGVVFGVTGVALGMT
ncbi:hypothetical protein A2368_00180 [Candidatus Collierbacteria bacterium RIFOXYB1_FULL_49_13]|uniref:Uncharacterized protein n=1 Tax=Candidatus Collierbacteria bacterium RIFOXYB1_FULL_49_13 TaxID=1817728 RepID=A0A1F5FJA5_9BACT|nr:MAG: hypothetical protein A2368_00180 [Candidatus Collierbacteria bacterium RIFOXYB1_FULL_49_13]